MRELGEAAAAVAARALGPPRSCSRAAAHASSGAGVARTVGFGREGAHALEALQRALLGRAAGLEEHLNVGRRRDRRARQLLHGGGRIEGRSEANAHGNDELEHCTGLRARKGRGLASAPATPSASDAGLRLPQHAAGCLSTGPDRRARKLPPRAAWHSGGAVDRHGVSHTLRTCGEIGELFICRELVNNFGV